VGLEVFQPKRLYTTRKNTEGVFFKIQYITYRSSQRIKALVTWFAVNRETGNIDVVERKMWTSLYHYDENRYVDITEQVLKTGARLLSFKKKRRDRSKKGSSSSLNREKGYASMKKGGPEPTREELHKLLQTRYSYTANRKKKMREVLKNRTKESNRK
jgi:hypothetical protein